MNAFRKMKAIVNSIRLRVNNMIKEIRVDFSSPGTGFFSFIIYPKMVKRNTITATAKLKITEEASRILVDL
jgi:hypothetical protein